jgi:hypothetical protein
VVAATALFILKPLRARQQAAAATEWQEAYAAEG